MRTPSGRPRSRVVVAGEALIDLIVRPDGGIDAVPGGGPYNTARTVARLEASVAFFGRLSTDRFGRQLADGLASAGVATDRVVVTDDPTTLAVAELDERGTASYRFYLDGTSAPGLLPEHAAGLLGPDVAALHVGTLGLVLEPMGATIEDLVTSAPPEVLVMLDPNCRPSATRDPAAFRARIERIARRADVIKVSDDDLHFLEPGVAPSDVIDHLLKLGAGVVLRTDGGRAVELRTTTGCGGVPVPSVRVVDTVGAGDAFGGGFLAAWVGAGHGRSDLGDLDLVRDAVASAVEVAAMTCTRPGADPPTLAELRPALA
jgi:fructokinase